MQQLHSIRGEMRQGITLRTLVTNNQNTSDTTSTANIPVQQVVSQGQVPNNNTGTKSNFAQDFAQAFTTSTLQQQPAVFTNPAPPSSTQHLFTTPTSTIALQKSVDAKQHPFSTVQFGYTHHKELEDESTMVRTERMGSGADFLNIAILEQNFAEMLRDKKI